jgi:hypothetical protein
MQFIGRHRWIVVVLVVVAIGLTAHVLNLSGLVFDTIRSMHGGG